MLVQNKTNTERKTNIMSAFSIFLFLLFGTLSTVKKISSKLTMFFGTYQRKRKITSKRKQDKKILGNICAKTESGKKKKRKKICVGLTGTCIVLPH
jgi:hypothetical protein